MSRYLRTLGVLVMVAAAVVLHAAEPHTKAAIGSTALIVLGFMGFGLCVMAGLISRADRNEANGLKHPTGLEGKN